MAFEVSVTSTAFLYEIFDLKVTKTVDLTFSKYYLLCQTQRFVQEVNEILQEV